MVDSFKLANFKSFVEKFSFRKKLKLSYADFYKKPDFYNSLAWFKFIYKVKRESI